MLGRAARADPFSGLTELSRFVDETANLIPRCAFVERAARSPWRRTAPRGARAP